jgi:hypothetical protein
MQKLIERSSLGSRDARQARAKVSPAVGRQIARAAITGRYVGARSSSIDRKGQG